MTTSKEAEFDFSECDKEFYELCPLGSDSGLAGWQDAWRNRTEFYTKTSSQLPEEVTKLREALHTIADFAVGEGLFDSSVHLLDGDTQADIGVDGQALFDRAKLDLLDLLRKHQFSTGHGDRFEDVLAELDWQIAEMRERASPPLQPTPPAQPVIGRVFPLQIDADCWGIAFEEPPNDPRFRAEAEALAFIESCRSAQPNGVPVGEADRRDERDEFEKDEGYAEDLRRDDSYQGYINPETQYIYQIWRDGYRAAIAQQKETGK